MIVLHIVVITQHRRDLYTFKDIGMNSVGQGLQFLRFIVPVDINMSSIMP